VALGERASEPPRDGLSVLMSWPPQPPSPQKKYYIGRMSKDLSRFWVHRGGIEGFERWRKTGYIPQLLVRVVAPGFVAGFIIDDEVRRCAPILRRHLMGKTEVQAREIIARQGWKATILR